MTTPVGSTSPSRELSPDLRFSGRDGLATKERSVCRGAPFASHFHRVSGAGRDGGGVLVGGALVHGVSPQPQERSGATTECFAADALRAPRGAEVDADRPREGEGSEVVGFERPIDPMFQILVPPAPRSPPAATPAAIAPASSSMAPVDQLLSKLVRRVAWSGNGRSGSARLELGAGALEGATLTVHADEGAVRVSLDLPPGVDGTVWRDRIAERLGARGLRIEALEIT